MLRRESCRNAGALTVPVRRYALWTFSNFHGWTLPNGGKQTNVTKEELQNFRYFNTRSRDKWDYNRIDENITSNSEFRDTSERPIFEQGQREDNSFVNDGHVHTPSHYRLYEYFDEYTKPGTNKKVAACYAVKEQWDSEEFYYPGESWKKNRPGFRSVPKEILNRDTWYGWADGFTKVGDIQATMRTRSWNPAWPPPGYKMPRLQCKKEFEFGTEDPCVVSEIERYYWYRSWLDNNMRAAPKDLFMFIFMAAFFYYLARSALDCMIMRMMFSNTAYPGRHFIRSFGTPKDWETGLFWWQVPLEEFPNNGEVFWINQLRYGYIREMEKRDELERVQAQL